MNIAYITKEIFTVEYRKIKDTSENVMETYGKSCASRRPFNIWRRRGTLFPSVTRHDARAMQSDSRCVGDLLSQMRDRAVLVQRIYISEKMNELDGEYLATNFISDED